MRNNGSRRIKIAGAVLSCCIAVAARTPAQERKPIGVEDILNTKRIAPLVPIALSPDGTRLAYTVQDNRRSNAFDRNATYRTGLAFWGNGSDIWIQNLEPGRVRNLTGGNGNNWLPAWSPDGHYLAFFSTRGTSQLAHLWVWDTARDELRQVTDKDVRGDQIEWTRDAQHVLVTTVPEGVSLEDYVDKISGSKPKTGVKGEGSDSTAILYQNRSNSDDPNRLPQSDPWSLDEVWRDLISIDVGSGEVKTLAHDTRIASYFVSPDGSRVAYTIPTHFEKPGSQQTLFDLVTVRIADNQSRTLATEIRLAFDGNRFRWSPDSSRISFRENGPGMAADCYVAAVEGQAPRKVTALEPPVDYPSARSEEPLWDAKGKSIFFIHHGGLWQAAADGGKTVKVTEIPNREIIAMIPRSGNLLWTRDDGASTVVMTHDDVGKQDGFYGIDLRSGESHALLENGQCYTCATTTQEVVVTEDGRRVVFSREDAQHDNELWMSDASFKSSQRLTNLNPQLDQYEMGTAKLIHWLSDDGRPLQGTLLLPSGYKGGMRCPLIVWVYAGALLSNRFDHFGHTSGGPFNMQLFATRGYAILLPDMPVGVGTPMLDMAKSVLPGVNKVIEMGVADPGRLGIMGHSFGGYSTLSLIVLTNRFKAAIDASGIGDLVSYYGQMGKDGAAFGTSVAEEGQASMRGTLWTVRDRYIANSPVFDFDRIETPLLIVHGSGDDVVAPFQADEVFVDLRRLGKEVEYARYEGEDHSPAYWRHANQVDLCNRIIAWFDSHLKQPAGY
jgi:dipeptidyl aminopeptidase/acylaminoacyl peptidase